MYFLSKKANLIRRKQLSFLSSFLEGKYKARMFSSYLVTVVPQPQRQYIEIMESLITALSSYTNTGLLYSGYLRKINLYFENHQNQVFCCLQLNAFRAYTVIFLIQKLKLGKRNGLSKATELVEEPKLPIHLSCHHMVLPFNIRLPLSGYKMNVPF